MLSHIRHPHSILLALLLVLGARSATALELRVDRQGARGAFTTLEQARDEIRRRKANGLKEAVTVWISPGIYPRTVPFELDERDSGAPDAPIIYRGTPGGKVRFLGGQIIAPQHARRVTDPAIRQRIISEDARDQIRVIDLRALGITEHGAMKARGFRRPYVNPGLELFIDGTPRHLARWPNKGSVPIGKVLDPGSIPRNGDFSERGGTFTYAFDRPAHWALANDIWLSGLFGVGYADDTIKVAKIDTEKQTIAMAQAHMYGIRSGKEWLSYYALNLLEEIDEPGEMYLDRSSGRLYVYPTKPLDQAEIAVSMLEQPMLCLEGVSHVTLRDLTFEVSRGMGCYIERGTRNTIGGCTFRNLGSVAVCIGKGTQPLEVYAHQGTSPPASRQLGSWHEHIYENPTFNREGGTGHRIIGCDISNTGAGGVSLGGGDRVSLTPANNVVENCHIHHFNRLDRSYKGAVNIDGCGNQIRHSLIHDGPNNAIYLHGNDHLIEQNEIHSTCTDADDMGAFYMGRDPSERGNVIRWNFWHHNGSPLSGRHCDIYFDDGSSGVTVHGNVFYGARGWASVFVHAGIYHKITNNIFVDCNRGVRFGMWGAKKWHDWLRRGIVKDRLTTHVPIDQSPYRERYPDLVGILEEEYPLDSNIVQRNVLVGCDQVVRGSATGRDNWATREDPGFAQPEALDFHIEDLSRIRAEIPEFEPIPFRTTGLRKGSYRHAIPVTRPTIVPANGLVSAGESVSLASRNRTAVVRYTLDGTIPGPKAKLYTGPFPVSDKTMVTALALDPDTAQTSTVVSKTIRVIVPGHPTRCTPDGWVGVGLVKDKKGVDVSSSITRCDNGDWVSFGPFDFDALQVKGIEALVGIDPKYANQTARLRLGAPDGPALGSVRWQSTGSFHVFKPQTFKLDKVPKGSHVLYWCFEGGSGVCNLKRFRFLKQ